MREGGCRCDAVRYALATETPPRGYACQLPGDPTSVDHAYAKRILRICDTHGRLPTLALLRAGTVGISPQVARPARSLVRKQSWFVIPDATPTYVEQAPLADLPCNLELA